MFERLGIMYLSSALKIEGHQTELAYAKELGFRKLDKLLFNYRPEIVACSIMTGEHNEALKYIRYLKKNNQFLSVFGGPHPTFFPEFINENGVDAICIGEGDLVFPKFCNILENKGAYWTAENFYVKVNEIIYKNDLGQLVEDLDSLPFPDRDIMYSTDFKLCEAGPKLFTVSRGCPYRCTYCFNHKYNEMYKNNGKILRHRSPESIVKEIREVKNKYNMTWTYFADDTFLLKPEGWLEKFCTLYKNEINLPFGCSVRANVVNQDVIFLKNAGLWGAWMGVECANVIAANEIFHRNMDNDTLLKAAVLLHENGIKICAQNIVGLPAKNAFEIDKETLDFNIKLKPEHPLASILYPYPGTEIETYAIKHGFLKEKAVPLETNKTSSMLDFSSKMEKRKIENLHKLFAIFVWLPFLRKYCDFICSLPLGWLFKILFYLSYGFGFKVKMSPPSAFSFRRDILNYTDLFFRMIRKS